MHLTSCPVTQSTARHLARVERQDDAFERHHAELKRELIAALMGDSLTRVSTPEFNKPCMPAFELVNDHFAGKSGDANLIGLLAILKGAAQSSDPTLAALARSWINDVAQQHADFHASAGSDE